MFLSKLIGHFTALASGDRTASQTITSESLLNSGNSQIAYGAMGAAVFLNITAAPGVETLQLILEEQDPTSRTWVQLGATTARDTTGMVHVKIHPGITPVAASVGGFHLSNVLSGAWRIRIVHSAASSWTYSVGVSVFA